MIGALDSHQRITKRTGGLGNKKTSGDHPNYYIVNNGQNPEKTPGDCVGYSMPEPFF